MAIMEDTTGIMDTMEIIMEDTTGITDTMEIMVIMGTIDK
jgi:hypothetical protein